MEHQENGIEAQVLAFGSKTIRVKRTIRIVQVLVVKVLDATKRKESSLIRTVVGKDTVVFVNAI